jgi:hypothetical protein
MELSSVIQGHSTPASSSQSLGSAAKQQTLSAEANVKAQTQQALKAANETAAPKQDPQNSGDGAGSASQGRGTLIDIKI